MGGADPSLIRERVLVWSQCAVMPGRVGGKSRHGSSASRCWARARRRQARNRLFSIKEINNVIGACSRLHLRRKSQDTESKGTIIRYIWAHTQLFVFPVVWSPSPVVLYEGECGASHTIGREVPGRKMPSIPFSSWELCKAAQRRRKMGRYLASHGMLLVVTTD
jgi:hypothetical protein